MDYLRTIEYRIEPVSAYRIIRNCSGCGKKAAYVSIGQFRVNANGNRVDIWLIYQCEKCKHTYNLAIYERVSPNRISREKYRDFLGNDQELALQYGTDLDLLKRNKAEPDINGLEFRCKKEHTKKKLRKDAADQEHNAAGHKEGVCLMIYNPYRLKIRVDRILPELLGLNRSQVKKMVQEKEIQFQGTYLALKTEILCADDHSS